MPVAHLPAPNGIWRDTSSSESGALTTPKDKARDLTNFLVDFPGKLRVRGPIGDATELYASATVNTGIWVFGEKFLVSKFVISKLYDTDAGTVTNVTLSAAARQLDGRSARVGTYAYGPSTDSATGILRWDGTTAQPIALSHSPVDAADVCSHLERLFVAGGTEPGTTTPAKPNALWWSDVGGPAGASHAVTGVAATDILTSTAHGFSNGNPVIFNTLTGGTGLTAGTTYYVISATTDTFQLSETLAGAAKNFTTDVTAGTIIGNLSDWQDDASGLANQILVGEGGDPIVGLYVVGRTLLVFKTYSIWAVYGDTPASFVVRRIADSMGLHNKTSAAVVNDAAIFVNDDGRPVVYDGAQFARLDGVGDYLDDSNSYVERLGNDHVFIMTTSDDNAMLHVPTRGWSILDFDSTVVSSFDAPSLVTTEQGETYLVDDEVIRSIEGLTSSAAGIKRERKRDDSGYVPIQPAVTYRTVALGTPFQNSVVRRLAVDYKLGYGGVDNRWLVQLSNIAGTTIPDVEIDVVNDGVATKRHVVELHQETSDLIISIEQDGVDPSAGDGAELYDVYVEFEPAQRR